MLRKKCLLLVLHSLQARMHMCLPPTPRKLFLSRHSTSPPCLCSWGLWDTPCRYITENSGLRCRIQHTRIINRTIVITFLNSCHCSSLAYTLLYFSSYNTAGWLMIYVKIVYLFSNSASFFLKWRKEKNMPKCLLTSN